MSARIRSFAAGTAFVPNVRQARIFLIVRKSELSHQYQLINCLHFHICVLHKSKKIVR